MANRQSYWTKQYNRALARLREQFPMRDARWYDREAERYADRRTDEEADRIAGEMERD